VFTETPSTMLIVSLVLSRYKKVMVTFSENDTSLTLIAVTYSYFDLGYHLPTPVTARKTK
jgi:hypothetical protein